MGYYSDVAIAVKKKDYEKFIATASNEAKEIIQKGVVIEQTISWMKDTKPIEIVILTWKTMRWYGDSPAIKEITKWYLSLKDYEFVRSGEERGDLEAREKHEKDYWYILDTYQGITIDEKAL